MSIVLGNRAAWELKMVQKMMELEYQDIAKQVKVVG
jgi:hypothetical protein